ncbi:hypothetical protein MMC13_004848 [Lambiella insularis]|nr:hypothetical protein [Lambiella insularis]
MSSIKQVQDLEKQLSLARQEVSQLRSMNKSEVLIKGEEAIDSPSLIDPSLGPSKRRKPNNSHDFKTVRQHMAYYGDGVIRASSLRAGLNLAIMDFVPELPLRHSSDSMLEWYLSMFQCKMPVLDWPTFVQQYEDVYRHGTLRNSSRTWIALLFTVLACGSLKENIAEGQRLLGIAKDMVGYLENDVTMDHVRCATLMSTFFMEVNARSAAWTSLGCAVRIAQDIGLHRSSISTPASTPEEIARQSLWWSIYVSDRLLSLELARPPAIDDDSCNFHRPISDDGRILLPNIGSLLSKGLDSSTTINALTEVVQCVSLVLKSGTTSLINSKNNQSTDERILRCFATFPSHYQLTSKEYLSPHAIFPLVYLQDTRLSLHRRNLSPTCAKEIRSAAIESCVSISQETTRTLARTMQYPPEMFNAEKDSTMWHRSMRTAASASLCLHIWRCTLFLCFKGDYQAALVCVRISAAIGNARPVNISCGQYLDFFIQSLLEALPHGERSQLERNEDMMAYVSGDLQNSPETAWIWQLENQRGSYSDMRIPNDEYFPLKTGEGKASWNGWDQIIGLLERLLEEQRRGLSGVLQKAREPMQQDSMFLSARNDPNNVAISPGGSNRISIADIM